MSEAKFLVVFDGQLVPGADPAQVRANVAKVFKTDVAKVEPLFSGRRTVIKRGLDEATAGKYRMALERAGAVVTVVDGSEDQPASAPPAPAAPPPTESPRPEAAPVEAAPVAGAGAGEEGPGRTAIAQARQEAPSRTAIAEAGRAPPPLVARGVPSAPESMSMAEAGALLIDEPSTVEAPDIDTSHLTLSDPGADLTEPRKVAAPEFDLSAFELAPPGTALGGSESSPRE